MSFPKWQLFTFVAVGHAWNVVHITTGYFLQCRLQHQGIWLESPTHGSVGKSSLWTVRWMTDLVS